jgi:hypothetical protein
MQRSIKCYEAKKKKAEPSTHISSEDLVLLVKDRRGGFLEKVVASPGHKIEGRARQSQ